MGKINEFLKGIAKQFTDFTEDKYPMERGGPGSVPQERAISIIDIIKHIEGIYSVTEPVTVIEGEVMDPAMIVAQEPMTTLLDVYVDNTGTFAIITKDDGKLYKIGVSVDKDNVISTEPEEEVSMEFAPASNRSILVKREASGNIRWFAMPACTAVLNRSGEIDSTALFDSFVEHIEDTKQYPVLDFYHQGEKVVLGRADWVARDGVTYCASGLFEDTPIAQAAGLSLIANPGYWGLSIAYFPTSAPEKLRVAEGVEIPVYTKGINRYISLLPERDAASILTSIQEVSRMKTEVMDALKKLVGDNEPLLKEFEEKIDSVNREAEGMISREDKERVDPVPPAGVAVVEPEVPAVPAVVSPVTIPVELDQELLMKLIKALLDTDEFKKLFKPTEEEIKAVDASVEAMKTEAKETADGLKAVTEALAAFIERVETADKEAKEVEDNLPAKIARNVYRPRAAILPQNFKDRKIKIDMAAVAASTLQSMEKE